MNDILLKALDLGGTLALALAILFCGGQKLDKIDDKLDKLMRIFILGLPNPGKKGQAEKILEEK